MFAHGGQLMLVWPCNNAAAAIKAGAVMVFNDHRFVHIYIMHYTNVDTHNSRVITEVPFMPLTANVAAALVTKAIINAAIKTYGWPPIACMKYVNSANKSPVRRRP